MKKFLRTMMLAAAMLLPFVSQAQNSLTIADDGTATSYYVPAYVYYFDDYTRSQFVVPASELSAMNGGSVSSMTFYTTASNMPYTSASSVDVYLMEVSYTSISAFESKDSATIVYSGTLNFVATTDGGSLTITFTTPFAYNGGNLLVGIENTTDVDYKSIYFYGEYVTGASVAGYNSTSLADVSPTQRNFLPATTFTYTGGSAVCNKPATLVASGVTAHDATLTWASTTAGSYQFEYKQVSDSSWNEIPLADTTYTLTGLLSNTAYDARVKAICGAGNESGYRNASFTTQISCPVPTNLRAILTPGDGTVATLSWHEVGTASAWQICFNDDTTNYIDVYDTTYSFTTLTPETAYTAKVRALCDVDDMSTWSNTITFTPTNDYLITINDGTTTNGYVPIYGFYCDDITKSQFIIPAADLAALQGGLITKLTFYASQASVSWGNAEFNVYLTITNDTTLSALADYTTMTQVYAGSLSISDNKMVVNLTAPYLYAGGNLMVGFLQTLEGSYVSSTWHGVTATGASMGGYNTSVSQRNFLPKTTINYIPGGSDLCLPVSGLAASDVTTDSATISWTGTASSYTIIDLSDSTTVATITDTFYVFSGLTAMTQYSYGVIANCASNQSIMMNVNFTTGCAAVAIPFTEDFEATSPTLGCWSVSNLDGNSGLAPASYAYSGSSCFVFSYNTNPPQYLISPELSGTESGVTVSFMYKVQSANYPESFQLGYSTTTDDTAAFTWGTEQTNLTNTTYMPYSEILPAGVKYVSIKYTANDMYYLFIDSMVFNLPPSCMPITGLTVDTVTSNSVTLSWSGDASSYTVYNDTVVVDAAVTATSYTITGLDAATNYTFGVAANCGTDQSDIVTISTRTDCAGGSCFVEINGADSYGDGWNGNAINVMQNGELIATFTLALGTDYYSAHYTVCSGSPVTLTWVAGSYPDEASFEIKDGAGMVVYTGIGSTSMATGDTIVTINNACPSCLPVTNMAVSDATENSVTLSWNGTAASYDVYNDGVFVTNTTSTSYTFTGLTAATGYVFGVQAICTASDSAEMVTVTATTSCGTAAISLPFTETFDATSGTRACWSTIDADGDGFGWSTLYHGNDVEIMLSASYDDIAEDALTPNNWLISPKLHTVAGTNVTMEWTVGAAEETFYAEHYGVYVSTTTTDTTAFTLLNEWTLTSASEQVMNLDLTAYAGQDIYVAFRHFNCTDEYMLLIDDVSVYEGVYVPDTLTVTFAVNNAAMGTTIPAPGTYQYLSGDTVSFRAVPNAGYHFVGWAWAVDGGVDTLDNNYISASFDVNTFVSYGNMTFTAIFEAGNPDSVAIVYAVNDATMGTITPAPGTHYAYVGDLIQATATPNSSYQLSAWVFDLYLFGDLYASDTIYAEDPDFDNPMIFGMLPQSYADYDVTLGVTALFEAGGVIPATYIVSVSTANGEMGTAIPMGNHTVNAGEQFTVTAVPNPGYHFVAWVKGSEVVSTANPYTFVVDTNIYLTATFAVNDSTLTYYEVRVSSADNEMGTVSSDVAVGQVAEGTVMTVTATANEGYRFLRWVTDGGVVVSTDNPYTFTVSSNVNLVAIFERVSGIEDVEDVDFQVYSVDNRIVVKGIENQPVYVYDVTGRSVEHVAKAAESVEFTVHNAGVYLVKVGNAAADISRSWEVPV